MVIHLAILKGPLTLLGKLGVERAKRNAAVIAALQKAGYKPGAPPNDFAGVYAYTLAEYGVDHPSWSRRFFADRDIKAAVRYYFEHNDIAYWYETAEAVIERMEDRDRNEGIEHGPDPRRDFTTFLTLFDQNLDRTRSPWQTRQDHRVEGINAHVGAMHDSIQRIASAIGKPLTITGAADVKPVSKLGIRDFNMAERGYRPDVYIARAIMSEARRALNERGGVIIVGKPTSGKTRLAWKLMEEYPEALVVFPQQSDPPELFDAAGLAGRDVILFFDNLHQVADTWEPLTWRARLRGAGVSSCLLICTSRAGSDWEHVEEKQQRLLTWLRAEAVVFTSQVGAEGRDLSRDDGWLLAQQLGLTLSDEEFDRLFDGTPGSLTLDVEEMKKRAEALHRELYASVSGGRLLDAAKVLHAARQRRFCEATLLKVAQAVGTDNVSRDVWERIKERTQDEGFGRFTVSGEFETYRPYLEKCVSYQPLPPMIERLVPLLMAEGDDEGMFYLGVALYLDFHSEHAEDAWRAVRGKSRMLARNNLCILLSDQPGREQEAEQACRDAIAAGIPIAYHNLGNLLAKQPGREQEAEQAYRDAISRGYYPAYSGLGNLLTDAGRNEEAEQAYRAGVAAGFVLAHANLGQLLRRQPGRVSDAEQAFRMAAEQGFTEAYNNLGLLLAEQPGREAEAEQAYRDGIAGGEVRALCNLGNLLARQSDRHAEAEQAYRHAIAAGMRDVTLNLGILLSQLNGREAEAEKALKDSVANGLTQGYYILGDFLRKQSSRELEAEEMYKLAIAAGDDKAYNDLGVLLGRQPGREAEAEQALRNAIETGDKAAYLNLGIVLIEQPSRKVEGCEILRKAVDAGIEQAAEVLRLFC